WINQPNHPPLTSERGQICRKTVSCVIRHWLCFMLHCAPIPDATTDGSTLRMRPLQLTPGVDVPGVFLLHMLSPRKQTHEDAFAVNPASHRSCTYAYSFWHRRLARRHQRRFHL